MKTPEEKSKTLNLPLLSTINQDQKREDLEEIKKRQENYMKMVNSIMNELYAICDKCGKDLSYKDCIQKQPCGDIQCPFGYETNK